MQRANNDVQFTLKAEINAERKPVLNLVITNLNEIQFKLVQYIFDQISDGRFTMSGDDFSSPGTKRFETTLKSGDEARIFIYGLAEAGLEFAASPRDLQFQLSAATRELIALKGPTLH